MPDQHANRPLSDSIEFRLATPSDDITRLTALLHRAYAQLGDMGLRYMAVDQTDEVTLARMAQAECHVALLDGAYVGTVLFKPPERTSGSPWLERPDVAGVAQLAVDPVLQKHGLGTRLMALVEARASACGAREIALDTAEPATHLRRWYESLGYRFVEYVQWKHANYRSVVLSKTLDMTMLPTQQRPADFVDVAAYSQQDKPRRVQIDIRYAGGDNFIGRPVAGYGANKCLLTRAAASAAMRVVDALEPYGLTLRFLDAYRPQRAVDDFIAWAGTPGDEKMKPAYYPEVDKQNLFKEGYLAQRSSHSRGSAMDVAIAAIDGAPGEMLDFGTAYDYFGRESHPSYPALSPMQRANRLLLRTLMVQAGFKPIETEWWHFQLADEPYPRTYFDFPVE